MGKYSILRKQINSKQVSIFKEVPTPACRQFSFNLNLLQVPQIGAGM